MTGLLEFLTSHVTLILLLVALVLFGVLATRSKNIRSFHFQISIFILIWIAGEVVGSVEKEFSMLGITEETGMTIHVIGMAVFSLMIWARFYYSRRAGKKLTDSP